MVAVKGESLSKTLWRSAGAEAALDNLGLCARGYRLVTTLPSQHLPRCAFRVSLSDGRIIKLRRLSRLEDADRLWRLRESLPSGFVAASARCDAVLLEPWIAGRRLRGCSQRRLAQAAAMLRSLHDTHALRPVDPLPYVHEVQHGLIEMEQVRMLSPATARELRDLALAWRPQEVQETLLHHDFCAENLVVSPDDALWAVDNETLRLGPAALELARLRHRWPMPAAAWRRFLNLYDAEAPSPFWHVLARLRGALWRARHQMRRTREAVDRLHDLLDGECL
jgi:aminoglycoside phosphotransferase